MIKISPPIKARFPTVEPVGNCELSLIHLFSNSKFFNQSTITLQVLLAQVSKQSLSLTNQLHKSAVSREIFFVGLKVFRNVINALS